MLALAAVTTTDQPIYVKNGVFEGWLVNPKELQIGNMLFNLLQGGWIEVTALEYENGAFTVYDVQTSGTNTVIANSILLDAKLP